MPKDPAFLYYDADVARDISHMNLLEKGAYFILLQSQRKFGGGYTMVQIGNLLGNDLVSVWNALELVLERDESEKFYIPWLRDSLQKRSKKSDTQRSNVQKRWQKEKIPPNYDGNTMVIPPVNVNVNVNENENKGEGEGGGKPPTPSPVVLPLFPTGGKFNFDTTLPDWCLEAVERNQYAMTQAKNTKFIRDQWEIFILERANDPPMERGQFQRIEDLTRYFTNWMRNKKPAKNGTHVGRGHRETPTSNGGDPTLISQTGVGKL